MSDAGGRGPESPRRPATLRVCSALLAVQALGFLVLAGAVLSSPGPEAGATEPGGSGALLEAGAFGVVGFCLVLAAALALAARALWQRRRWPRGAAVAWGVLLALVGLSQLGANLWVALGLAVVGAATAGLAIAPATRLALVAPDDAPS